MADTLKNLQYMTINKGMKHIIGGDKMSHFPDMNIQDDSTLYAKLLEKKRSTFDRSKFTVVGSPTITDDGVANGFSGGDFVIANINLSQYNSFSVKGDFKIDDWHENQIIFGTYPYVFGIYLTIIGYNAGSLELSKDGISIGSIKFNYNIGEHYFYDIVFTGTEYKLYLGQDKTNLPLINTILSTTHITSESNIAIGQSVGQYVIGSIDLKQFSITVDGKEVFNGNKTGVDQIKADNFTKVGSPVISDDGIASGFSISNYINTSVKLVDLKDKSWSISVKWVNRGNIATSSGDANPLLIFGGLDYVSFRSGIAMNEATDSKGIVFYVNAGDASIETTTGEGARASKWYNTTGFPNWIIATMSFNMLTGTYSFYIEDSFEPKKTLLGTYIPNTVNKQIRGVYEAPQQIISFGRGASRFLRNAIDFNDSKIYIDGQLVYQPTLRIPYTQSKTGSKIVDAVYRDRVQDMYEQFGYTHYYTIGDVPEKYNVVKVGSPTLVGGIASGFSKDNYLKSIKPPQPISKFSIKTKVHINSITTSENDIIGGLLEPSGRAHIGVQLRIMSGNDIMWVVSKLNEGDILLRSVSNKLPINNDYLLEVKWESNKYLLICNNEVIDEFASSEVVVFGSTIGIGNRGNLSVPFAIGSIDLSQFSIEVDGIEVFRGYEPAITDAFTLATNKGTDIIESYSDGNGTYYEVRADLVQRCVGQIAPTSTEVTYPRPFRDADNIVQVSYFDVGESTATPTIAHIAPKLQTKDGFTIGATTNLKRNYYAEGKAVLG